MKANITYERNKAVGLATISRSTRRRIEPAGVGEEDVLTTTDPLDPFWSPLSAGFFSNEAARLSYWIWRDEAGRDERKGKEHGDEER